MANEVLIPHLGRTVKFPDREMMRRKGARRMFARLGHVQESEVPTPPPSCDWSLGEKIKYPILGNDQYGDCYEAAPLHHVQTMTGQFGPQAQFDVAAVIARYLEIAGGDNGLYDDIVYAEWKRGNLGPDGPHKILDSLIVDISNVQTLRLAIWAMLGTLYTCSLPSDWANNAEPGAIWTTGAGRSVGGHAILLTGYPDDQYFDLRTWGLSPPVKVTHAGMLENDPEVIVVFSTEMFHPTSRLTPNGHTWEEIRQVWIQHGGHDVGPDPLANPTPVVPPAPLPPGPVVPPSPPAPAPISIPITLTGTASASLSGATTDGLVRHGVAVSGEIPLTVSGTFSIPAHATDALMAAKPADLSLQQWLAIVAAVLAIFQSFSAK